MLMYADGLEETLLSQWVVEADRHVFMILLLDLLDAVQPPQLEQTPFLVRMGYTRPVSIIIVLDILQILSWLTMGCYHVLGVQTVTKSFTHKIIFNLDVAPRQEISQQLPHLPVRQQTLTCKSCIPE